MKKKPVYFILQYRVIVILLFLTSCAISHSVFSQSIDTQAVHRFLRGFSFLSPPSNEYIFVPGNSIVLRPGYYFEKSHVSFSNNKGDKYSYHPNTHDYLEFYFSYKGAGLSASLLLPVRINKIKKFGETHYSGLGLSFCNRFLNTDLYFKSYRGLYAPVQYAHILPDVMIRKDMKYTDFSFKTIFSLSDHYSLSATFNASEIQKKSAVSFIVSIDEKLFVLKADSNPIPVSIQNRFPESMNLHRATYNTLGLLPGFAYTHVINPWYGGILFSAGPAIQSGLLTQSSGKHSSRFAIPFIYSVNLAAGYNMSGFFVNVVYRYSSHFFHNKEEKLSLQRSSFEVNLGVRI